MAVLFLSRGYGQGSSMFLDEEFAGLQRMAKHFTIEESGKSIRELEQEIEKLVAEKPEGFEPAIQILLQGRNFLARLSNRPEVYVNPSFLASASLASQASPIMAPNPVESKKVAIYCSSKTINASVRNFLFPGQTEEERKKIELSNRLEFFSDIPKLLEAVMADCLCGIINLCLLEQTTNIESLIRHDLKNRPSWGSVRASEFVLPPCCDFREINCMVRLFPIIQAMKAGCFYQVTGEFDFNLAKPSLRANMVFPEKKVTVWVVDDQYEEIKGICAILNIWPEVAVEIHEHKLQETFQLGDGFRQDDIVLMDEQMGQLSGTDCAGILRQKGFTGIIASITGGERPKYTPYHFGGKTGILRDFTTALAFVRFFNTLLANRGR